MIVGVASEPSIRISRVGVRERTERWFAFLLLSRYSAGYVIINHSSFLLIVNEMVRPLSAWEPDVTSPIIDLQSCWALDDVDSQTPGCATSR